MPTFDAEKFKQEIYEYLDVETLKGLVGKAGDASWSPFKFGPDGKPIGFQAAVIDNSAFALPLIEAAAHVIEKMAYDAKGVITGEEKKKALIDWLNSLIDIPWVPNVLEDNVIGWILELVIGKLNLLLGKNWIEHIPTPPALVKKVA